MMRTLDEVIAKSGCAEGVYLSDLPLGAVLELRTENRRYLLQYRGNGKAVISGHPELCPEPVVATIHGSTWGGSMLKMDFIGKDMHLEFRTPPASTVTTSRILEIHPLARRPISDDLNSS